MTEENEDNKNEEITQTEKSKLHHQEPPIGGGGGSFFFDIPQRYLELEEKGQTDGYYVYKFNCLYVSKYTSIEKVCILTEKSDGEVKFNEHPAKEEYNLKLRLWVSENRDAPNADEPDIIIDGDNGGFILSKEQMELVPDTGKNSRQTRYYYPDRKKSVVKWTLYNDLVGDLETKQSDDMYYFYIYFRYLHKNQ